MTPLQEILKAPAVEGYPRQLFILTGLLPTTPSTKKTAWTHPTYADGEVSNTQACIDYVRKNSHTTRVFTFGIGNEASQDLVKGMAKAGEGFFEFILPGENMEEKVMKQLGRAMQPALTDVSLIFPAFFCWGGGGANQTNDQLFIRFRWIGANWLPSKRPLGFLLCSWEAVL